MNGTVIAVSRSGSHTFSKLTQHRIRLIVGLGIEGDAHLGTTTQHCSQIRKNPDQPNRRQVHLIHTELHAELRTAGFDVAPGQMGENITTEGIDLLRLPTGTRLYLGDDAIVEVTGLRNPCRQLERFKKGLMAAVLDRDADGNLIRKAGVMSIVLAGGEVKPGDAIRIALPSVSHRPLEPV